MCPGPCPTAWTSYGFLRTRPATRPPCVWSTAHPTPACNPYLAFSALLAAGMKGIEEEYPLPSPITGNVASMSTEERTARGIVRLPTSMGEAIALAEDSDLLRKTLGDFVFEALIRNKKQEWEQYRSTVTDYEISRYLPLL